MWPTAPFSKDLLTKASEELAQLIERQFSVYCSQRSTFGLVAEFDDTSKSDFLAECKTELLSHLSPSSATIVTAKTKFKEDNCYNVLAYWCSVAFELPCLHLIYKVLSVCASSEAAC